ncbi:peroxisomal biogenesis factor 19 isoform X1 [Hydra vulgaris]|uniref:Peroxin-19 n=1 Tax=Hydra vulgaris TaxID=6087 RepID=T2MGC0_HYDVU|nr:peroxisomal biogenesis factor 19-like isoform X1 [Hydra vulgaris]
MAASNPIKVVKCDNHDEEDDIDALLDDALKDFNKPISTSSSTKPKTDTDKIDNDPLFNLLQSDDGMFDVVGSIQEALEEMSKEDPALFEEYRKFQEQNEGSINSSFDDNIAKTMEELTKSFHEMGTASGEDGFEEIFRQVKTEMGTNDNISDESAESFMNMMQGMMQNLLSKELLYPSLKEIKEKYPDWLETNRLKISSAEFENYVKQEAIIKQLCTLFEEETASDSPSVKKIRMGKVVDLMQQMQKYGHPPADMMSQMSDDTASSCKDTPGCSIM